MKLRDLSPLMARRRAGGFNYSYSQFSADPALNTLQWPDDVLEQFLFDHGSYFMDDYGDINLCAINWQLESIPAAGFLTMPTGESDGDCIERFAETHAYRVERRPPEVGRCWEERGTWLRPPLLLDRRLLNPSDSGLQVLEGRTRVGVLRGRLREELHVAPEHQAWVGRP
ncbi:hypothetical protein ABZS79_35025 [Streptomyces griseoloalbus]|uniref:hypothetical protein n=1 Tax=Streptomyces griseoloalbus TaxID=67303 RepID=UPI0033B4016E